MYEYTVAVTGKHIPVKYGSISILSTFILHLVTKSSPFKMLRNGEIFCSNFENLIRYRKISDDVFRTSVT